MTTIKQHQPKVQYKWIVGLSEGKLLFLGPYPDDPDEKAEGIAVDKFTPDNYEIIKLKYSGSANATRAMKHIRLENQTIQEAVQRVHHKTQD